MDYPDYQSPSERLWHWLRHPRFPPWLRSSCADFLPADRAQWLFLVGLLWLLASSALATWIRPEITLDELIKQAGSRPRTNPGPWNQFASIVGYVCDIALYLSAIGAIALAFTSSAKPFRRFARWVLTPTLAGHLLTMVVHVLALNAPERSVFGSAFSFPAIEDFQWPGQIGPGPILAAASLTLLGVCFWLAENGKLRLPITFAHEETAPTSTHGNLTAFFMLAMVLPFIGSSLARVFFSGLPPGV